jgi:hypothetical protein
LTPLAAKARAVAAPSPAELAVTRTTDSGVRKGITTTAGDYWE